MSLLGKIVFGVILLLLIATFIYSIILMCKIMKHKLTEEEVKKKTKNMWILYLIWMIVGFKIVDGTIYVWLLNL